MIPGDLATRLRQLTDNTVQPLTLIHKLPSNLPDLIPGQQFTAQIQTPLPDGSYQALVAGKTVTLALPHAVKSGDVLELIVTGQQEESLTARLAPSSADASDAPKSTLSQTGRLISQLLTGRFGEQRATSLARGEPLLPSAPDKAQQLTPHLQQAVSNSGLFYESHLQKWTEGSTSMATLLKEPHAQFMPGKTTALPGASTDGAYNAGRTLTELPQVSIQTPHLDGAASLESLLFTDQGATQAVDVESAEQPALGIEEATKTAARAESEGSKPQIIQGNDAKATHYEAMRAGLPTGHEAEIEKTSATEHPQQLNNTASQTQTSQAQRIPDALMPLIYQQLETMATHQMQYQFQPWPGMNVEWDVVDPEAGGSAEEESDKAWRSSMRLHLPRLGEIDALLVLGPQGLSVRIDTDNGVTAARMRVAGTVLLDALTGAGLSVAAISVSEHASA